MLVQVAVKWIHLAQGPGVRLTLPQIRRTLQAEINALYRLRASIKLEDRPKSNVVHFVGITSNSLTQEMYSQMLRGSQDGENDVVRLPYRSAFSSQFPITVYSVLCRMVKESS